MSSALKDQRMIAPCLDQPENRVPQRKWSESNTLPPSSRLLHEDLYASLSKEQFCETQTTFAESGWFCLLRISDMAALVVCSLGCIATPPVHAFLMQQQSPLALRQDLSSPHIILLSFCHLDIERQREEVLMRPKGSSSNEWRHDDGAVILRWCRAGRLPTDASSNDDHGLLLRSPRTIRLLRAASS